MIYTWIKHLMFTFAIALMFGCSESTNQRDHASFFEPIYTKQYRAESLIAIVSLSETNITSSGSIQLTLDIHAAENMNVPDLALDYFISPFTVTDHYAEPVQQLPSGKQLTRRVWTLIPPLPGTYSFLPLELQIGTTQIETAPIKVHVSSLLPKHIEGFEIKDITDPVTLLPQEQKKHKFWSISSMAVALIILLSLMIRQLCRPKKKIILTANETALLALEQLPEDELTRIQELNKILLRFIAQRFNLPATSRTRDELFPLLPKNELLGRREALEDLLTESEHICFSNQIPNGFALKQEEYIRSFVEEVKEPSCV